MIPEPQRRFAAAIGRVLARHWSAKLKTRSDHDDAQELPNPLSKERNPSDLSVTVTDSDSVDQ